MKKAVIMPLAVALLFSHTLPAYAATADDTGTAVFSTVETETSTESEAAKW